MLCKFSDPNYEWHNDLATRSNSTGLKKTFKTAQKRNVKPGMATYWYNSMLCKFSDPNYEWHNDLSTRSNSTGRNQPASKRPLKRHKKEMLSLVWLHIGTIVCCASFQIQIMSGTTILSTRSNSTGLKKTFKMAQKRNVKPDMATYWYNSMLCKFSDPNYEWHNDLATRSKSTGLKKTFKMAQKRNVKPGMATYWYNSMLCKFSDPNYEWHNNFIYPVKFDRSNLTGLKKTFKMAQKRNVKPDMATYWYNSMLCKFSDPNYEWHNDLATRSKPTGLKKTFKMAQKRNVKPDMATYWYNSMLCKFSDPNYEWHNDLSTRSNSTGRIRLASKRPLKRHKKEMLSLIWLHIGTIVCCASFQTQIMSGTTI